MSDDWLPGFRTLPVIGVSILTGVAAALAFFVVVIADSPLLSLSAYKDLELLHAVATIVAVGAAAGAIIITPLCLVLAAVGTKFAAKHPPMAKRTMWGLIGALVGGATLCLPFAIWENGASEFGWIAAFGAGCGLFAAIMCHRLLQVGTSADLA